jgi:hypothetical protein
MQRQYRLIVGYGAFSLVAATVGDDDQSVVVCTFNYEKQLYHLVIYKDWLFI